MFTGAIATICGVESSNVGISSLSESNADGQKGVCYIVMVPLTTASDVEAVLESAAFCFMLIILYHICE